MNTREMSPSGPENWRLIGRSWGRRSIQERLADVTKQADQLDEMIAKRGLVLDEDIVVERGAYLPGVSVDDSENAGIVPGRSCLGGKGVYVYVSG